MDGAAFGFSGSYIILLLGNLESWITREMSLLYVIQRFGDGLYRSLSQISARRALWPE